MGIQSSINSLLSQAQSLAAFYKGFEKAGDLIKGQDNIIKGQEAQTEATKKLQESFVERFRKAFNIDDKATLTKEQERAIKWGMKREKETGKIVHPGAALWQARHMEVKNEIASDLARASVEARTASINKTKSNFDEHTASLIKYYSKGSGNP